MNFLDQFLSLQVYTFMLMFCRIAAATTFLVGFGESFMNMRNRLVIALGLTMLLTPVLGNRLPPMPADMTTLALLVMSEFVIGLFIGMIARVMLMSLDVAGQLISFQAGLSNAFAFNPAVAQQGSLVGAFMVVVGITLIFSSDGYQLMLSGLADSYDVFVPGQSPLSLDFVQYFSKTVEQSFYVGFQIASPLILIGTVFYLGLGLVARLIPQIQIFFIGLPIQIVLVLIVFAMILSSGMLWFLGAFKSVIAGYMV